MILKTAALGLGGVAVAGGGGTVGILLNKKSDLTLKEVLKTEGYLLISDLQDSSDEQWTKEFEFYKESLESTMNKDSYKSKCDSTQSKKLKSVSDQDYLFLIRFCIISSIEKHLQKQDKKSGSKNYLTYHSSKRQWEKIYDSKKDSISQITTTSVSDDHKDQIVKEIQLWCYENSKKKYFAKKEQEEYKKVEEWCTSS